MNNQITNALIAHGSDIFAGAMAGIDFGSRFSVDQIAFMAKREGLILERSERGSVLIWSDKFDGVFELFMRDDTVYLEAASADDFHE